MIDFKKRLIVILIISFVIILVSGGLFYYFRSAIVKKVEKIDTYKKELAARDNILNKIHELEQEQFFALSYTNQLKTALPTESEMVGLEGVLQSLANQNNLDLSFRFGLLNEAKDQEPQSYSFNLVLSGEQKSILQWLEGFQSLSYSTRLEQIELTQTKVDGSNLFYNVKILGRVYLR